MSEILAGWTPDTDTVALLVRYGDGRPATVVQFAAADALTVYHKLGDALMSKSHYERENAEPEPPHPDPITAAERDLAAATTEATAADSRRIDAINHLIRLRHERASA